MPSVAPHGEPFPSPPQRGHCSRSHFTDGETEVGERPVPGDLPVDEGLRPRLLWVLWTAQGNRGTPWNRGTAQARGHQGRGTKGLFSPPTSRKGCFRRCSRDLELQAWSLEGDSPHPSLDPPTVSGQAQGLGIKAARPWGPLLGHHDSVYWESASWARDVRYWPLNIRARETGLRMHGYGVSGLGN